MNKKSLTGVPSYGGYAVIGQLWFRGGVWQMQINFGQFLSLTVILHNTPLIQHHVMLDMR